MRVGRAQRGQKASPVQALKPVQEVQASNSSADTLSQQFSQIVDNFAAQSSASDASADSTFAEALQVGGEISVLAPPSLQATQGSEVTTTALAASSAMVVGTQRDQERNQPQRDSRSNQDDSSEVESTDSNDSETVLDSAAKSADSDGKSNLSQDANQTKAAVEKSSEENSTEQVAQTSDGELVTDEVSASPQSLPQEETVATEEVGTPELPTPLASNEGAQTISKANTTQAASSKAIESVESSPARAEAAKTQSAQASDDNSVEQSISAVDVPAISDATSTKSVEAPTAATASTRAMLGNVPDQMQVLKTEIAALIQALETPIQALIAHTARASDELRSLTEGKAAQSVTGLGAKQQSTLNTGTQSQSTTSNARESAPRAARGIPPTHMARTMEKVEQALKEAARARDGKTISLRLDPPDLGTLKVDVSLRDGNLRARVVAEQSAVYQQLREKAHELHSALRKLGLNVDSISVSVSGDSQSSFSMEQFVRRENEDRAEFFSNSTVEGERTAAKLEADAEKKSVIDNGWVA
ncbi:MAG: flagellar hook-length control protein FliK [Oligoflexia bacterium]|nr:flagellar hook-length control protein FliK [Oligoflexia bacterium]